MSAFSSLSEFRALLAAMPSIDQNAMSGAQERNDQLTKPPGALGRLEELAIWYGGWRGTDRPRLGKRQVIVFAGRIEAPVFLGHRVPCLTMGTVANTSST